MAASIGPVQLPHPIGMGLEWGYSRAMKRAGRPRKQQHHIMLTSVELERFKAAFKPGPIPLSPFTVIIGRNGSGKSTVVEALQWLDAAVREDADKASAHFGVVGDLFNVRTRGAKHFSLKLDGDVLSNATSKRVSGFEYSAGITAESDASDAAPVVWGEILSLLGTAKPGATPISMGAKGGRQISWGHGAKAVPFRNPKRLAMAEIASATDDIRDEVALSSLADWFRRSVFLRLSPAQIGAGTPMRRTPGAPLLDEQGGLLPLLLSELTAQQRTLLMQDVQSSLPDMLDVAVVTSGEARDRSGMFGMVERMPYVGRKGEGEFPIPAWMLSEGTRRITAIYALLRHDPPPSLLCIEEIENGLDPWTTMSVIERLRSAATRGTQVVVTTHSPWLLDHVPLDSIIHVTREKGETRYARFETEAEVKAFSAYVPPGQRYVELRKP